MTNKQKSQPPINACPSSKDDESQAQCNMLPFDLLTLNDPKTSNNDSELISCDKHDSYFQQVCKPGSQCSMKEDHCYKKGKAIQKRQKEYEEERKINMSRKRRIAYLQNRVQELQKQVLSLRRNQHECLNCRERLPGYYRERITQLIQPQEPAPSMAGNLQTRRHSKQSIQFQKIDFHVPLMQTQQMQQKMWVFLGTMLIAMGSKVMDFDGTINTFRVLKQSVDRIRREVQKGESKVGMDFFCCKQELSENGSLIDGITFDPFYNNKEDPTLNSFSLQGVKIQSVQQFQLFYDYKYNFNIKYDALLTIMEYARDHCTLS